MHPANQTAFVLDDKSFYIRYKLCECLPHSSIVRLDDFLILPSIFTNLFGFLGFIHTVRNLLIPLTGLAWDNHLGMRSNDAVDDRRNL